MKHAHRLALAAALAMAPLPVLAQVGPPDPGFSPSPQVKAAMQQSRALMEQLHTQTKTNMLSVITAAHRTAIANVIAQLALAPSPNYKAAAAAIDAFLTPAEKQGILNVSAASKTQAMSIRQQTEAALASSMTPAQQAEMQARRQKMQAYASTHTQHVPDPGMVALRTFGAGGGGGWGGRGH